MRGAELDRDRKIGAHAHRQILQAIARSDLGCQREMRRRGIVDRRDAHQAGNDEAIFLAAACNEGVGLAGRDAGLLRLLAGVQLDEQFRAFVLRIDFLGQRLAQAGPVDRMDGVEQRHSVLCLVGLQRADQVQRNSGMGRNQRRPFRLGFLHAIFAEHALSGIDNRRNRACVERLRHRDQRHRCALAASFLAGAQNLLLHLSKAGW
jgi:hypothetical protein